MKFLLRLLVSVLPLLAVGCTSLDRMVRVSPFSDAEPTPQRTNAWPLYWSDHGSSALLWPLADWDEQGFAVRPLAARDGDEFDLLWPLAHVSLDDGSFWALTAYHHAATGSWGLAPLFGWGRTRFVGPVFWTKGGEGPHGLFPLYWRDETRGVRVVAPLWWELGDSFALAPLWWHSRRSDSRVLFPFWWQFASADGSRKDRVLFPLAYRRDEGPWHHVVTPLGGRGWSDDGAESFTNVLGPLYHSARRGDDYSYTAVLWPVYASERTGERRWTRLAPLWERETDPTRDLEDTRILLGLGRHVSDPRGQSWRLSPLVQWADTEAHEHWLDPFTLYRHVRTPTSLRRGGLLASFDSHDPDASGEFQSWTARLLLIGRVEHDSEPPVRPPLEEWRSEHAPDSRFARDRAGLLFDWFLWDSLVLEGGAHDGERAEHHNRIPLLWEYQRTRDRLEWDALLWCVSSERSGEEDRFLLGWGLYRRVQRGEHVKRDVFPFFTWDSGPDSSDVSFLGRVFRRSRRGEKTGGYFLFVPWGDELD
ncbi:MAG: hypothetical protein HUU28_01870 [Planctomycetaceae bacterium]|nr:hypothetical protein [Planctomycetaceae bacterium]